MAVVTVMALTAAGQGEPTGRAFSEKFAQKSLADWSVADYAFSHASFDTDWSREQVDWKDGLELHLEPQRGSGNRFSGASIRRRQKTHYGRYEIVLQPARGPGVVTGFFTYTGGYYGTRHDEVDIEFLGRDTRKMHAAWFVDGKVQSRFVDLGYDAASQPRRYVFEWFPDEIRWYEGDRLLLRIAREEAALPQVPGYLYVNIWAADPSIAAWSGRAAEGTRARALVKAVRFTPLAHLRRAEVATGQRTAAETAPRAATRKIATMGSAGPRSVE